MATDKEKRSLSTVFSVWNIYIYIDPAVYGVMSTTQTDSWGHHVNMTLVRHTFNDTA